MLFDIKTIMFLNFLINLISAGAVAIIWVQNRKRFHGIHLWLINMSFQATGSALILLRGHISDLFTMVIPNILFLTGATFLYIGMGQFTGIKPRQSHNYVFLGLYIFGIFYSSLIRPDVTIREIIISSMIVIINSQIGWLLLHRTQIEMRKVTRLTGIILGSYAAVSIFRLFLLILFPLNTNDFFKTGLVDSVSITLYIVLSACLSISLILMVNTRLNKEILTQETKFTTVFLQSPIAIMLTKATDGTILEANESFEKISGYKLKEVIGRSILELSIWLGDEKRTEVIDLLTKGEKVQSREMQFRKKTGDLIDGLFSASLITIDNAECLLSSIIDITELSQIRHELQFMATHDPLTGLSNRNLFYDHFELALANACRENKMFAVMSIDLDDFKQINDKFGHDYGDIVLIDAAKKIGKSLRKGDTASRFGGDEFVLLIWNIEGKNDAKTIAEKLLQEFAQPIIVNDQTISLTISIGIAIYPENGTTLEELLKISDINMYYAKEHGKNSYKH